MFSFWESNYYGQKEAIVIVGGGITGLSTALSIKELNPQQEVIVVEKQYPPQGASTKNAGFVCFGSTSEILDDLTTMTEQQCIDIIKMRWQGSQILQSRMAVCQKKKENTGGKELFAKGNYLSSEVLQNLNDIMLKATGIASYFMRAQQEDFPSLDAQCITMKEEGQINAMDMMSSLFALALKAEVKFILGLEVTNLYPTTKQIKLSNNELISYQKLALTTNGFTHQFYPNIDVHAARNQVLMTSEIPALKWSGVYHHDKGYYYFRRYGNRILLGGARNKDLHNEMTPSFGNTAIIQDELIRFLEHTILGHNDYKIEKWWSGILGIGASKYPILEEVDKDVFLGVRLGGMGVAIGSYLGKEMAMKMV